MFSESQALTSPGSQARGVEGVRASQSHQMSTSLWSTKAWLNKSFANIQESDSHLDLYPAPCGEQTIWVWDLLQLSCSQNWRLNLTTVFELSRVELSRGSKQTGHSLAISSSCSTSLATPWIQTRKSINTDWPTDVSKTVKVKVEIHLDDRWIRDIS